MMSMPLHTTSPTTTTSLTTSALIASPASSVNTAASVVGGSSLSSSSLYHQRTMNISIASSSSSLGEVHTPTTTKGSTSSTTTSSIKDRIKMFGGEQSKIQKRLDQLSKKWEKDSTKKVATFGVCGRTGKDAFSKPLPPTPPPPTKVEWYTSPNSKMYKKRIIVL